MVADAAKPLNDINCASESENIEAVENSQTKLIMTEEEKIQN